jgi:hypothetical protein
MEIPFMPEHCNPNAKPLMLLTLALPLCNAAAAPIGYQDLPSFLAAVETAGLSATREGFEGIAPGTRLADGDALGAFVLSRFRLPLQPPSELFVAEVPNARTASPLNALSKPLSDAAPFLADEFENGDGFRVAFSKPTHAFGLWFITQNDWRLGEIFADDFALWLDGARIVANLAAASAIFAAPNIPSDPIPGYGYFLGILDTDAPLRPVTIATFDELAGAFFWRADDFYTAHQAPLPPSLALLGLGIGLWAAASRVASIRWNLG